jgi:cardiolipin synthase
MLLFLDRFWPHVASALTIMITLIASGHAILNKRDARSAIGWTGLIWIAPILGALLYVTFGVNRIRRSAKEKRQDRVRFHRGASAAVLPRLGNEPLTSLALAVGRVTGQPLLPGNRIVPLVDGDVAYAAMCEAIDNAKRTIALASYIFDNDETGRRFADALSRAKGRGVEVRVLIDAIGARYTFPPILRALKKLGLRTARFMPTLVPWRLRYSNLRSHRKILVIDGEVGFTGGMNIRAGTKEHPIIDVHFRIEGPVVSHLREVFFEDWSFATGEILSGTEWAPELKPVGTIPARGIADGPDEDFEKFLWTISAAVASAQRSIIIVTPYFLPEAPLISALSVAAMRGVDVRVLIPQDNNLTMVGWAMRANLWQLLEQGVHVHLGKPPFDHSKLLIVDGEWVTIGSANWDPRSIRLNFEFNIEAYDKALAASLTAIASAKLAESRELTRAEVDGWPLPIRLRDGVARLFSPYL